MFRMICSEIQAAIEVIFYATVTCSWWILSLTVLFPFVILLKFSETVRQKFFSWIFSRFILPMIQTKVFPFRKKCFDLLKEHLFNADTRDPVRILEIGIGSGENLEFYPENSRLIALDKNQHFEMFFRENREKYPNVHFEKMILNMAEDMHELEDSSVDAVVSTYVFCSVIDAVAAIREVKRVLKPGGKFAFLEHVAFPYNRWGLIVQRLTNPLWALYFGGCYLNRNTAALFDSSGFSDLAWNYVEVPSLNIWVRPQIYGIATR